MALSENCFKESTPDVQNWELLQQQVAITDAIQALQGFQIPEYDEILMNSQLSGSGIVRTKSAITTKEPLSTPNKTSSSPSKSAPIWAPSSSIRCLI